MLLLGVISSPFVRPVVAPASAALASVAPFPPLASRARGRLHPGGFPPASRQDEGQASGPSVAMPKDRQVACSGLPCSWQHGGEGLGVPGGSGMLGEP